MVVGMVVGEVVGVVVVRLPVVVVGVVVRVGDVGVPSSSAGCPKHPDVVATRTSAANAARARIWSRAASPVR